MFPESVKMNETITHMLAELDKTTRHIFFVGVPAPDFINVAGLSINNN